MVVGLSDTILQANAEKCCRTSSDVYKRPNVAAKRHH